MQKFDEYLVISNPQFNKKMKTNANITQSVHNMNGLYDILISDESRLHNVIYK